MARLQDARLAVLRDLLRQRDDAQREVTNDRLNQTYSNYEKERETKLHKIQNDYSRCKRNAPSAYKINTEQ